jgi:hypothetical protein
MCCVNCGKEIPDDAHICLKCGTQQRSRVQSQIDDEAIKWETCEIFYDRITNAILGEVKLNFCAEVIGPTGNYHAGESRLFWSLTDYPSEVDKRAIRMCDYLRRKLESNGWEAQGRGQYWFSYQFRRRINLS